MDKKEFALKAILPYYKDNTLCGYENNNCKYLTSGNCKYLTSGGKKCVFGSFMTEEALLEFGESESFASTLIRRHGEDILIPEARGVLSTIEWHRLQAIHDAIAKSQPFTIDRSVTDLGLFTMEELEEAAN